MSECDAANKLESDLLAYAYLYRFKYTPDVQKSIVKEILTTVFGEQWLERHIDSRCDLEFPQIDKNLLSPFNHYIRAVESEEPLRGRRCGHLFRTGETVYRCKQCSFDETCVMCRTCYYASGHDKMQDHEVHLRLSGSISGCCDCGDPEAWKIPLHCDIHSVQADDNTNEAFCDSTEQDIAFDPARVEESLRILLQFCVAFAHRMFMPDNTSLSKVDILKDEELGRVDQPFWHDMENQNWCIALWNDEFHTFNDVINLVTVVLRREPDYGFMIANNVDYRGREIVAVFPSLDHAIEIANDLGSNDLRITIRNSRDTFREELTFTIINLIAELVKFPLMNQRSTDLFGQILTNCLMTTMTTIVPASLHIGNSYEPLPSPFYYWNSIATLKPDESEPLDITTYLLLQEIKLPKSVRTNLNKLLLNLTVHHKSYYDFFSIKFTSIYRDLAEYTLLVERESSELIFSLAVQLFTTQTTAVELVNRCDILREINAIIYSFYTFEDIGKIVISETIDKFDLDMSRSKSKRISEVFDHLNYILQSPGVQQIVQSNIRYFRQMLDIISLIHGMQPCERRSTSHVEYEDDTWVTGFGISSSMAFLIEAYSNCYRTASIAQIELALRTALQRLHHWIQNDFLWLGNEIYNNPPAFDITQHKISFHHPIHCLIVQLLNYVPVEQNELAKKLLCFTSLDQVTDTDIILQRIVDHPLRVLVWVDQISARLWVRNGLTLRLQAHYYKSEKQSEFFYEKDLCLVQYTACLMTGNSFILFLMDRYLLSNIMDLNFAETHAAYDFEAQNDMLESMLLLIISISTERSFVTRESCTERIYDTLANILCLAPISHSDVVSKCSRKVARHEEFERIFTDMTDYIQPKSVEEKGLFKLKREYYSKVNPYAHRFTRNERQEILKLAETVTEINKQPKVKIFRDIETQKDIMNSLFTSDGLLNLMAACIIYCDSLTDPTYIADLRKAGKLADDGSENNFKISNIVNVLNLTLTIFTIACDVSESRSYLDVIIDGFGSVESVIPALFKCWSKKEFSSEHENIRSLINELAEHNKISIFELSELNGVRDLYLLLEKNDQSGQLREQKSASDFSSKAKEHHARVLAAMQKQQIDFTQSLIDGDSELLLTDSDDEESETITTEKVLCIICQEICDHSAPYGALSHVSMTKFLRNFPTDPKWLATALECSESLDMEDPEFYDLSFDSRQIVTDSDVFDGFPDQERSESIHIRGCGHKMHLSCFSLYLSEVHEVNRRQLYRNRPESVQHREVLCPLCKSLNNIILPVTWNTCEEDHSFSCRNITKPYDECLKQESFKKLSSLSTHLDIQCFNTKLIHSNYQELYKKALDKFQNHGQSLESSETSSTANDNDEDFEHDQNQNHKSTKYITRSFRRLNDIFDIIPVNLRKSYSRSVIFEKKDEILLHDSPRTMFWRSFIETLKILEASARGRKAPLKGNWIYQLSEHQLSHLRTIYGSCFNILTHGKPPLGESGRDFFFTDYLKYLNQVILGDQISIPSKDRITNYVPFLNTDRFDVLVYFMLFNKIDPFIDIHSLCQFCLAAEILAASIFYLKHFRSEDMLIDEQNVPLSSTSQNLQETLELVFHSKLALRLHSSGSQDEFFKFLDRVTLVFFRRVALLCELSGMKTKPLESNLENSSELDRLASILDLFTPRELFSIDYLKRHSSLCTAMKVWVDDHFSNSCIEDLNISYFGLYKLIKLPKTIDSLYQAILDFKCPKCNRPPFEPAICLVCGQIVCLQGFCCVEDDRGEANNHAAQCCPGQGMFLVPRKGAVVLLSNRKGQFIPMPYLDAYGESDIEMRRSRPQYLNEHRYAQALQNLYLDHFISDFIARRLDIRFDHGGWEAM